MGRSRKAPKGAFLLDKIYVELTYIINKSMNKYEKWYTAITERAKNRTVTGYTESHHVIPRSLGGSDDADNLVDLTAREHFVCHWLLVKIHTGESRNKMIYALRMMRAEKHGQQRYESKITARVYESIKKEYSEIASKRFSGAGNGFYGKHHTPEAREAIRQKNIGNQINDNQREKIVQSKLGKKRQPFNEEWKENLSRNHKSKQPDFDGSLSNETRRKIGDKLRGRKQTEEEKQRRALANTGKTKPKRHCAHCDRMIAVNTYARWHGDHCGLKNPQ
jgi:hypothetical protein